MEELMFNLPIDLYYNNTIIEYIDRHVEEERPYIEHTMFTTIKGEDSVVTIILN